MIPPIFARAVEEDIWVLGICADYLEDHGKDGSSLRIIVDYPFLLDDSGYSAGFYILSSIIWNYGYGHDHLCYNGDGYGCGITDYYGDDEGDGCGKSNCRITHYVTSGDGQGCGDIYDGDYCYGDESGNGHRHFMHGL